MNLLGRAVDLLPADDPDRRELLCELALAVRNAGDARRVEETLDEAVRAAVAASDRRVELRARVELANARMYGNLETGSDAVKLARTAIEELEPFADDRSLGRAWLLLGNAQGSFHGDNVALADAAARAAEHYRRSGWSPSSCLGALASALYYGPLPVVEAIGRCKVLLQEHAGDHASEVNVVLWLGGLEAMRGNFDEARSLVDRSEQIYEELGQVTSSAITEILRGGIELLAGQPDAAESLYRAGCDACMRFEEWAMVASRAGELADVLYLLGRYDEAEEWAGLARKHSGSEDRDAESTWRGVEARLAARRGDFDVADRLALEAVAIAEQTDALNHRAKLLLDRAEVSRLAGREAEAADAVKRAVAQYELKGNIAAAAQARLLLDRAGLAST
jgi:tetratricopeptide (TPR) repeat protein